MSAFEVKFGNPEGLFKSKAFSQVVSISGKARTIYIGGQNAVNAQGELVGKDDFEAQVKQALENIKIALKSENAAFEDVIKLNIYMVDGCDAGAGFKVFREIVGELKNPPLITVLKVSGLANPLYLIEIDAIAVVEEKN
ncbi:MAG TPA: RidA family protein [Clostridia bacterium]|jgi:enamine deaminase RidA (YjgF/YER057c/UK114 family)